MMKGIIIILLLTLGTSPAFAESDFKSTLPSTLKSPEGLSYVQNAQTAFNSWQDKIEECKAATVIGAALMCKDEADSAFLTYVHAVELYIGFVKLHIHYPGDSRWGL
jgi:hypothetical protein